jgi:hypothetical protein
MVVGCDRAPAVGLLRDATPLCPVMPELHIETFRATTMIMASSGQIRPTSGHDHETAALMTGATELERLALQY